MRAKQPKISVITVVRNAAGTIEETVRSVLAQKYPDIEHIVVDGVSTDDTMKVLNRYRGKIAKIVSEADRGIYDAMNKGIALATGDIIGCLNADDIYEHPQVLDRIAAAFDDERVEACYGDLIYVDPDDMRTVRRYWRSCDYRQGLCDKGWMPAHPTFYVRRRVYERLGGFDLRYPRQADFELTMRFLEIGRVRSVYLPEILVRMRAGGRSNSSIGWVLKGNLESYRACKDHGRPVTLWFFVQKIASRLPQFLIRLKFAGASGASR